MDRKAYLKTLYPKLVSKKITEKELRWLLTYFDTDRLDDLYQLARENIDLSPQDLDLVPVTALEKRMGMDVYQRVAQEIGKEKASRPLIRLWPRIAAAAIAVVVLGVWFYFVQSGNPEHSGLQGLKARTWYKNDIAPGRNTATLTLADGKVIVLDTNKTNVVVTDSVKTMTMLTAATPLGGIYQVTLPDGTRVWLNADSKLTFPSRFAARRMVTLEGEAYLEVAKDKAHPFILKSGRQQVEVLGTHFNISSYADEGKTETTLLEGSIRLSLLDRKKEKGSYNVVLKPNQQATVSGNSDLLVNTVEPDEAVAWKEGKFVFDNEPIESIMRRLARWYNVEVHYEENVKDIPFTGSISRYDNISRILDKITYTQNIHFKIEGRTITVMH